MTPVWGTGDTMMTTIIFVVTGMWDGWPMGGHEGIDDTTMTTLFDTFDRREGWVAFG